MILKKTFPVTKNSFYELSVTLDSIDNYKKGIIKIINDTNGLPVFLPIKLPNVIFSVSSSERIFTIYFDTPDGDITSVTMYVLGLDISTITISNINVEQMLNKINLSRYRQLGEIEFTKYYLDLFNECSTRRLDNKLVTRICEEYAIYKDPNYFKDFVDICINNDPSFKNLEKHKHVIEKLYNKHTVLYLTSSIHDESQITTRIKAITKAINFDNNKYYGILCTKYGYPYDHPEDYYSKKLSLNKIDGVDYIALTCGKDNFNNNTLCSYVEKYILELIKTCVINSVNILHVQNNYINGIVAGYVAKKLGIKFIYDISVNEWSEGIIDQKTLLSDMTTMKINLEKIVLSMADKIIVTPFCYESYKKIFGDQHELLVLPMGIDTSKFKENKENMTKIKGIIQTVHSVYSKLISTIRTEGNLGDSKSNVIHNVKKTTSRVFLGNGITFGTGSSCGSNSSNCTTASTSSASTTSNASNSFNYSSNYPVTRSINRNTLTESPISTAAIGNNTCNYSSRYPSDMQSFIYNDNNSDAFGSHNNHNKQKIIYRQKNTVSKPANVIYTNQTGSSNGDTSNSNVILLAKLIVGYIGPIIENQGIESLIESIGIACKNLHVVIGLVLIHDSTNELEQNYLKKLLRIIVSLNLEKHVAIVTDVSESLKWAYVDFINVFYFNEYRNSADSYDYDTILQKLLSKCKTIVVSNNFYERFTSSLSDNICVRLINNEPLESALGSILVNKDKKISHALRNYANSHFSVTSVCNTLYDIYDSLNVNETIINEQIEENLEQNVKEELLSKIKNDD